MLKFSRDQEEGMHAPLVGVTVTADRPTTDLGLERERGLEK